MIDFLLKRPIAVIMAFLAAVILGCVTFFALPVSLLPDVAIPHITVHVSGDNLSAREMENVMVAPLRRQLMQVSGVNEIKSETRDGSAIISLTLDYGVDTDFAFIEVNEKIDAAMNSLPRTATRPKAIKASATDIPVLYLNITCGHDDATAFVELGEISSNIIRRRLEQLPEVAMVDVTGEPAKELRIVPDAELLKSAGLAPSDIENALNNNNADPGSMTVRNGYYEYNIHISNQLRTPIDVRQVRITKNGRIYLLGDFCSVEIVEKIPEGCSTYNGKRAVTMAIIKQDAVSMGAMEKAVDTAIANFKEQYPQFEYSKSRSQTQLLDFTISNLEQNLILGLILVFVVCALFMRSGRLPLIIGITIVVAVIITFLLFYLFRVSINIISLAGLILAVGMMIDNSVIVAENITQYRRRGLSVAQSCISGTNEMITPMLSSSLTTVAVFVPLVFMSGIAGAIFTDEAIAITSGLAASYIVGITLLPVLYYLFFCRRKPGPEAAPATEKDGGLLARFYDKGIGIVFSHRRLSMLFVIAALAALWPLFNVLDTATMPEIDSSETVLTIDWNENIDISENRRRAELAAAVAAPLSVEQSAYIGVQDFMLDNDASLSSAEAQLYIRVDNPRSLGPMRDSVAAFLASAYPKATALFAPPANVFEKIFSSSEPPLEARFSVKDAGNAAAVTLVEALPARLRRATGEAVDAVPMREQINISVDREKLALYNVDYSEVLRTLRSAFKGSDVSVLRSFQEYLPVRLATPSKSLREVLATTLVKARADKYGHTPEIPLSALVSVSRGLDFKTLRAGVAGEYVPVAFDVPSARVPDVMESVRAEIAPDSRLDVAFSGTYFSDRRMMRELAVILAVSLLMMYFILCAQFESFTQPLIVLLEIPIDITFALLCLWLCGQTLNLMAAIGIIVTCGIVVNDSILKLDAINELRKSGMPLYDAIHTAGLRRIKPIVMTSLTTIFAMVPVLFTSDMGSELQRPLAIAMIGSMTVGTLVSIFIIPLVFFLTHKK